MSDKWRVGLWWTWSDGNGSEADSVEVFADSREAAVVEAISQASAGRLGATNARQTPEVTSVMRVLP